MASAARRRSAGVAMVPGDPFFIFPPSPQDVGEPPPPKREVNARKGYGERTAAREVPHVPMPVARLAGYRRQRSRVGTPAPRSALGRPQEARRPELERRPTGGRRRRSR